MKSFLVSFLTISVLLNSISVLAYEPQGTTIKKDSCNVVIIIQIGIETDTLSDLNMIQQAANECFAINCDLPCEDRTVGQCKVTSKVVVVDWSKLSIQDKPKFHHVKMLPGSGVSYVDECGIPNSGKSSGGGWHRHEYSPKVYCHEILHLAGLEDRYRDCRRDRLHVDNCKDGKACTPAQMGRTPSCDGYEHDCMGSDVTKPVGCNSNFMEVVRLANDATFVCSEECCKNPPQTQTGGGGPQVGLVVDGGLGYYNIKHKDIDDDKLQAYGGAFSIGGYGKMAINDNFDLLASVKFNYTSVGRKRNDSYDNGISVVDNEEHFRYRFADLSIAANIIYQLQLISLYAGPEVAFILLAKSKYYGTTTYNGMSEPFGDKDWHKINDRRKIQLGLNFGVLYQAMLMRQAMSVYLNFYLPFTNYIAFEYYRNRLYNVNLGLLLPLLYLNNNRTMADR